MHGWQGCPCFAGYLPQPLDWLSLCTHMQEFYASCYVLAVVRVVSCARWPCIIMQYMCSPVQSAVATTAVLAAVSFLGAYCPSRCARQVAVYDHQHLKGINRGGCCAAVQWVGQGLGISCSTRTRCLVLRRACCKMQAKAYASTTQ